MNQDRGALEGATRRYSPNIRTLHVAERSQAVRSTPALASNTAFALL